MLFLDSTDLREIEELFGWGVVSGLTTNPLLLAKAGIRDVRGFLKKALAVSSGPISLEVTDETEDGMVKEARALHALDAARVTVKVPFSELGLRATHRLVEGGVRVNVTCCMSLPQGYLASLAGATFVSILVGRVRDMGYRAEPVIAELRAQLDRESIPTKIIVGSLRQVLDVTDALSAGAHIATVPGPILKKMLHNPKTDETIREFNDAWHALTSTPDEPKAPRPAKKRSRR